MPRVLAKEMPCKVLCDQACSAWLPCAHASIGMTEECCSDGRCGAQGKVVFVAPTRPLVAQQIDACYRFMGVPKVPLRSLCDSCRSETNAGGAESRHCMPPAEEATERATGRRLATVAMLRCQAHKAGPLRATNQAYRVAACEYGAGRHPGRDMRQQTCADAQAALAELTGSTGALYLYLGTQGQAPSQPHRATHLRWRAGGAGGAHRQHQAGGPAGRLGPAARQDGLHDAADVQERRVRRCAARGRPGAALHPAAASTGPRPPCVHPTHMRGRRAAAPHMPARPCGWLPSYAPSTRQPGRRSVRIQVWLQGRGLSMLENAR